jgi:hypothetical protein
VSWKATFAASAGWSSTFAKPLSSFTGRVRLADDVPQRTYSWTIFGAGAAPVW